uniref:uncharacterized protein LOC129499983 n=1 Tax=Nyctereutes procyonoides TaxID=34880 RepID=UPI002443CD3E|nr:uncharacterized protein LOC129499983 [Nyctereutes procyonoides]
MTSEAQVAHSSPRPPYRPSKLDTRSESRFLQLGRQAGDTRPQRASALSPAGRDDGWTSHRTTGEESEGREGERRARRQASGRKSSGARHLYTCCGAPGPPAAPASAPAPASWTRGHTDHDAEAPEMRVRSASGQDGTRILQQSRASAGGPGAGGGGGSSERSPPPPAAPEHFPTRGRVPGRVPFGPGSREQAAHSCTRASCCPETGLRGGEAPAPPPPPGTWGREVLAAAARGPEASGPPPHPEAARLSGAT